MASNTEEMEMPCLCDCGEWFDLNDGKRSKVKTNGQLVCAACSESERLNTDLPPKWSTLDSNNGMGTLRQHCFVPKLVDELHALTPYVGNVSLCGKITVGGFDEENLPFKDIYDESKNLNACKLCVKKYSTLHF
jgi:hypothetical protein